MTNIRASQVFESFVRGDDEPLSSPLLSTFGENPYVLRNHIPTKRPNASKTIAAAINVYGEIFYPEDRLYNSCSQVLGMLTGIKAHPVTGEAFDILYQAMRTQIGNLNTLAEYIGISVKGLDPVRDIYREHGLIFPLGDTVDDALKFVNRHYNKSKYRAAVTGPRSIRGRYSRQVKPENGMLTLMHWTLLEDETEAMMLRLSDTTGKITLVNLSQSG